MLDAFGSPFNYVTYTEVSFSLYLFISVSLEDLTEIIFVFQNPILTGREPDATDEARAVSIERSAELSEKVNQVFIQRYV